EQYAIVLGILTQETQPLQPAVRVPCHQLQGAFIGPVVVKQNIAVVLDHPVPERDTLEKRHPPPGMKLVVIVLVTEQMLHQLPVPSDREFRSAGVQALRLALAGLWQCVFRVWLFKRYVIAKPHDHRFLFSIYCVRCTSAALPALMAAI